MKGSPREDCVTRPYSHALLERLAEHVIERTPPCVLRRPKAHILVADSVIAFLIAVSDCEADPTVETGQRQRDGLLRRDRRVGACRDDVLRRQAGDSAAPPGTDGGGRMTRVGGTTFDREADRSSRATIGVGKRLSA